VFAHVRLVTAALERIIDASLGVGPRLAAKQDSLNIDSIIARYFLGFVFTVFGLNSFLNVIPARSLPPLAGQFIGALLQSHYMTVVFGIEIAAGVLLLATKYVARALVIIALVIVNIVQFVSLLWISVAYRVHTAFQGLLQQNVLENRTYDTA
jgi:putative oxidoreductase